LQPHHTTPPHNHARARRTHLPICNLVEVPIVHDGHPASGGGPGRGVAQRGRSTCGQPTRGRQGSNGLQRAPAGVGAWRGHGWVAPSAGCRPSPISTCMQRTACARRAGSWGGGREGGGRVLAQQSPVQGTLRAREGHAPTGPTHNDPPPCTSPAPVAARPHVEVVHMRLSVRLPVRRVVSECVCVCVGGVGG
jgi:hypothetical protein